jgi:hypothetical protein
METWAVQDAAGSHLELVSEHYQAEMDHIPGGAVIALYRRKTRTDRLVYHGTLEGRTVLDRQSVSRAALNRLAAAYPLTFLPYVIHTHTGTHGAWCPQGCTLPTYTTSEGTS